MSIQLDFINHSTDTQNSQIIIFGEPSGDTGTDGAVDAPLPVYRSFVLPDAGERVSVEIPGRRVALEVMPADPAGQPPSPPAHLTLPETSPVSILVQGGGTVPIYFVIAVPDHLARPSAGQPTPERPSAEAPDAPVGFLARLIAAIRRAWRMITGGR